MQQMTISWFRRQQTRKLTYAIKDWEGPLMAALAKHPNVSYTLDNRTGSFIAKLELVGEIDALRNVRLDIEPVLRRVVKDNYLVNVDQVKE